MGDWDDLLAIFRGESVEMVDRLAKLVEALREQPPTQHGELLVEALRVAHNLKGAALSVGHEPIGNLAHEFEERLSGLKGSTEPVESPEHTKLEDFVSRLYQLAEAELPQSVKDTDRLTTSTEATSSGAAVGLVTRSPAPAEPVRDVRAATGSAESSFRVDTRRLDTLMAHTSELLVTRSNMTESYRQLAELQRELGALSLATELSRDALTALAGRMATTVRRRWQDILAFGQLSSEINDAMKRVRMMPFAGLEPLLQRTVREVAQVLGKQVTLSVELGDIELDKHLLDQLRDPLMHILRNAVGHGIETPSERAAAGKPSQGRVQVIATMQGTQVRLEISDDGRGVDVNHIVEVALERGLVEEAVLLRMSDAEILSLLFSPLFSTASGVTQTSGRGVGLSVAEKRLKEVGGSVYISADAVLGGTTFYLTSPVSVVSVAGLLVQTGEQIYTLALHEVSRILSVRMSQVQTVDGMPVIRLADGDPIRVLQLWDLLGMPAPDATTSLKLLEIHRGEARLGLMVSDVVGEQELVTRPLPWNVDGVSHISGVTVLEDNSVALALDLASLFNVASTATDASAAAEAASPSLRRRILVVDDSLTSRTLGRNMLAAAGYEVSVAVDGVDAWKQLQSNAFDLLVSDINMPKLDGYELTRTVRGNETLGSLPVILVSTLNSRDDMERGLAAGANEYVVKGQYEHIQLLEAVNRLLQS